MRIISLVMVAGCAAQSGADVTPHVGTWHYAQVTLVTNTCNSRVQTGESGDFVIDTAQPTSFHVMPNDGGDNFTCSLSGGSFDCPNRAAGTIDYRPSIDAVATYHVDADGDFSDAAHATGSQHATVDCTGSQCSLGGTFPCTFSQDFAITAQ